MKYLFSLLLLGASLCSAAQTLSVSGTVQDSASGETAPNANILLYKNKALQTGTIADASGAFLFDNLEAGTYTVQVSFIGYKVLTQQVTLTESVNLGVLKLTPDPQLLEAAEVRANLARVVQMGDTTAFNADAYKVNQDANAQDLLAKMPGVVIENGTITAQGEEVKRVLVDGEEFFSNDPNVALQSLPAEIIAQVQVFDDQSDQSKFTGFDDGNSIKTLNIVTKAGKNNGQFGKVYGGYGTEGRYLAGGNMNFFNGKQRWTVLGLTNNINVQNFSTQDIVGAIGSSDGGGGGRGRRGRGREGSGASADANDFLVNSQGGISATNALGLNYSDKWSEKTKVNGSYFFNESNNTNEQFFNRTYLGNQLDGALYEEDNLSTSSNQNHRFNMKIEHEIDEKNSVLFRPSFSTQNYTGTSNSLVQNLFSDGQLQNSSNSSFNSALTGITYGGSLLYRHKFDKRFRTFSVNLNTTGTQQEGQNTLLSENFFAQTDSIFLFNQRANLTSFNQTYSANLTYTEPLSRKSMLLFDYEPAVQRSNASQQTAAFDSVFNDFTKVQPILSSEFESSYQTQAGVLGYMYRTRGENFMIRLKTQYALLSANQTLPTEQTVNRSFVNLLPHVMYRKTFENKNNVRLFYRSGTVAPTFEQLQTVIDNSNTLQLTVGNPNLDQQISHSFGGRYRATFKEGTRSFFAGLFGQARQDYIANATYIAQSDSLIAPNYVLPAGGQLTLPVNLDGYYNIRSFASYGIPVKALKSNLNLSGNMGYQRVPGLINNQENISTTLSGGIGAVLGSNINENIDFTFSYRGTYNDVASSLQPTLNNSFYQHTAGVKFNWLFGSGFVFNTDVNQTFYNGLDAEINQNFTLWNAGFGYKFLKGNRGELKLSVFDILGENNSISRTITETYVEDQQTTVLQQYFMLSFTYTFRNFGEAPKADEQKEDDDRPFGRPPGGGSGRGGPPPFEGEF